MALITLTTDFGARDHFTGAMKGVILSIAPRVTIVDITHEVAAFEVTEGAFTVAEASRSFPKKTIHVVVVDPGVGSARRPILVEAGGHLFLGPDNGVLSMIYGRQQARIRAIANDKYFLQPVSPTFHGRDIFAPVAAHLARGLKPKQVGPVIEDYLRVTLEKPTRTGKRSWAGTVLKVDRFGNLITNFHVDEFPTVRERPIVMIPGVRTVEKMAVTYAEAQPGEPVVIIGSSGFLEVCVNQDSAAKVMGCVAGSPVELSIY